MRHGAGHREVHGRWEIQGGTFRPLRHCASEIVQKLHKNGCDRILPSHRHLFAAIVPHDGH